MLSEGITNIKAKHFAIVELPSIVARVANAFFAGHARARFATPKMAINPQDISCAKFDAIVALIA